MREQKPILQVELAEGIMDKEHIVKSYDNDLNRLEQLIAEMGGLAEAQLSGSIESLKFFDTEAAGKLIAKDKSCLLYTSPSPRDRTRSRMPSSA